MAKNTGPLLIFDCDGVLVDSEPIANRIIIQCFRNEGFDIDEDYANRHFIGVSNKDCIAHMETVFKREVSESFLETYSHLTKEEIKQSLQPIAGISEALDTLTFAKCIASGSEPEKIQLSLEVTGLAKYFTHIFSSVQVPRGKPYPDVFLFAARQMNYEPDQCIVIEDSDPGVQAAISAGMKVLLYRPGTVETSRLSGNVTVFTDMSRLPFLI